MSSYSSSKGSRRAAAAAAVPSPTEPELRALVSRPGTLPVRAGGGLGVPESRPIKFWSLSSPRCEPAGREAD